MHDFYAQFARVINSGQSNSIVVSGNVYDLFWDGTDYVPLVPFLLQKTAPAGRVQLVYELNGPIRMTEPANRRLAAAWAKWRGTAAAQPLLQQLRDAWRGALTDTATDFQQHLKTAMGNSTFALELLRQLCFCSREMMPDVDLLIFIEGADLLIPTGNGDIASLNDNQLRRIAIMQDWFCDPSFTDGRDAVCLIAESRSLIHPRVSRLPQILAIEVPSPDAEARKHFINQYCDVKKICPTCHQTMRMLDQATGTHAKDCPGPLNWDGAEQDRASRMTAGLSVHALRQLIAEAVYSKQPLSNEVVCKAVEQFIQSQVGDDVVEFSRPHHRLSDVIGAKKLVAFIKKELLPRFKAEGNKALSGCAVSGPIGGGKTFVFEAVAAELDMPVMVLKNLRSQWYGQTDVIFERLKRALEALDKVAIFLDEADTQFGGVGADTHETERRLTGKIQQMMSDPRLKGRVIWLLMTARIQLLSPDIRRPGRVGDLILPVLDPEGQDRIDFIKWALTPLGDKLGDKLQEVADRLNQSLDPSYSAAAFAALRSYLDAICIAPPILPVDVYNAIDDLIPPAIGLARRYQTLQAIMNCTRKSLLPDPQVDRTRIEKEIRMLEAAGVK